MVNDVGESASLDQPLNARALYARHDLVAPWHYRRNQRAELFNRFAYVANRLLSCREMAEKRVLFPDKRNIHLMIHPSPVGVTGRYPKSFRILA